MENTLNSLIDGYLEFHSEDFNKTTQRGVRVALRKLVEIMGDHPVENLSPMDFHQYQKALISKLSEGTCRTYVAITKTFTKWLNLMGVSGCDLGALMKKPRKTEGILETLSHDRIRRILTDASLENWERLGVGLLFLAGLRLNEAVNLRWSDIHLSDPVPYLTVQEGKGGKSRKVPIHAWIVARLTEKPHTIETGTLLESFRSDGRAVVDYTLRRSLEDLGINAQSLRRSIASYLYELSGNDGLVSRFLGHVPTENRIAHTHYIKVSLAQLMELVSKVQI